MIIPEKKILFVHIPKTGGQSVTKYLLQNLGEKTNLKNSKYGLINNKKSKIEGPYHFHHLLLREYKSLGLVKNIDDYFKISVVRNPYSRFVSAFYFNNLQDKFSYTDVLKQLPFEDKNLDLYRMFIPQVDYLKIGGKIKIDKLFYQENLKELFNFFNNEYMMKGNYYTNISKTTEQKPLTKKDIILINQLYFVDFREFGYKMIK